jgi:hypothetical protein
VLEVKRKGNEEKTLYSRILTVVWEVGLKCRTIPHYAFSRNCNRIEGGTERSS